MPLLFLCLFPQHSSADDGVLQVSHHYDYGPNREISQPNYEAELILRLLERTEAEFGPFELVSTSEKINQKRYAELMRQQRYPNHVRTFGYQEFLYKDNDLIYLQYPVYLGMLSYRTCFVSKETKQRMAKMSTLEEIKSLVMGQGLGWADSEVLKLNDITVTEVSDVSNLFRMVALNRVDVFCRGANEILGEYQATRDVEGLEYEQKHVVFYPMPLFFYTHRSNTELIERLKIGLKEMHEDGSLVALWESYFRESVEFSRLNQRQIHRLKSPLMDTIDFDYEQYFLLKNDGLRLSYNKE